MPSEDRTAPLSVRTVPSLDETAGLAPMGAAPVAEIPNAASWWLVAAPAAFASSTPPAVAASRLVPAARTNCGARARMGTPLVG